jgi:hypothetical protein
MRNLRVAGLLVLTAFLMCVLGWKWVSQRGLVTLNYANAPLSQVVRSIERQGLVEIRTNAEPTTPVTIRLVRAPVVEAIETLAVRVDGDARLAYIAAQTGGQIREALAAFGAGANPGGWAVFSSGFARRLVFGDTSTLDPRRIEWKVSEGADRTLQALLDQGAQKTGALFAVPIDWNPTLSSLPPSGRVGKVTADLLRTAKGKVREIFLLTVNRRDDGPRRAEPDGRPGRTVFSGRRAERQENAEWTAERVQAQIALLPEETQADARKNVEAARAFWESIRGLPEEERLAKIQEHMNLPEVQLRMEERSAVRDAMRTPEQREQRYRNYIQRKEQVKGRPTRS